MDVDVSVTVTYDEKHRQLEQPWNRVTVGDIVLSRLYVLGDGSCAGGSCVRALADAHLKLKSLHDAQSRDVVTEFRTRDVVRAVESWTDDEWEMRVDLPLRGALWDSRLHPCAEMSHWQGEQGDKLHLSVANEKKLFCDQCRLRSYPIGEVFFQVAAVVLQMGVILLRDDCSSKGLSEGGCQVYEFGATGYPRSMVIYACRYPGGDGNIGHYETVGLPTGTTDINGTPEYQTLFPIGDPVLSGFRAVGCHLSETTENSAAWQVCPASIDTAPHHHTDVLVLVAAERRLIPAPAMASSSAAVVASLESGGIVVSSEREPDTTRVRRTTRIWTPSRSFLEAEESKSIQRSASVGAPRASSRHLVASSTTPPSLNASSLHAPAANHSSVSAGAVPRAKGKRSTKPSAPVRRPVVATHRAVESDRHLTFADSLVADVKQWIRRSSRHGTRLVPRVHSSVIGLWTQRCRTVLLNVVAALSTEPRDVRLLTAHLCVLWSLPGEVFSVPSRGGGDKRRKSRINGITHRLEDTGLIHRLLEDVLRSQSDQPPITGPGLNDEVQSGVIDGVSPHSPWGGSLDSLCDGDVAGSDSGVKSESDGEITSTSTDVRAALRATQLFHDGHATKAMQTLTATTGMADLSIPHERERLRALHPSTLNAMPQCPSDAPIIIVDQVWVMKEMRASDNGSSPGPSCFGSNYVSVLASDPACVKAITLLIQQILNNTLPPVIRTLLTTCTVVSLEKPGDGRRPLAMGDLFYRMASRYVMALVLKPTRALLSPNQYGVGQPDGCTQVVQSVQHLLTTSSCFPLMPDNATRRPLACLSIDVTNAFNCLDRAVLLTKLYTTPVLALCWRMVAFGYGQPSLLLMQTDDDIPDSDAFIESQMGVKQGDPLATLLFSVALGEAYAAMAAKVPSGGCFAYVDDGNAVGTLSECWEAWGLIQSQLASLGLTVNRSKCEVTCFHISDVNHPDDQSALTDFRDSQIRINEDRLCMLGCVVGKDTTTIAQMLATDDRFTVDQLAAFRRMPLMATQCGNLALQRLTGTVLTNRLRAMPPSSTTAHAAAYDRGVRQVARILIGITAADGDRYDEQLSLALSQSGFALTSAAAIAPAAYLAGTEITMRRSPTFSKVWIGLAPLPPVSMMYAAIDDCLTRINTGDAQLAARCRDAGAGIIADKIRGVSLPISAASFAAHFRARNVPSLQASLTHRTSTLSYSAGVAETRKLGKLGQADVARMMSLKEKESSLWLRTLPTAPGLRLEDRKWQWAAQLRLGVPVPVITADCGGCGCKDAFLDDCYHPLGCVSHSGCTVTDRHNQLLMVIARHCQILGWNCKIEPRGLDKEKRTRPDLQIDLPESSLLIDVTISHPSCKTWREKTVQRHIVHDTSVVGDAREAQKHKTYGKMAAIVDMTFEAVVFYTHGGFHASAIRFIKTLSDSLDPAVSLMSRSEFKNSLKQHIAIALQRGSSDIMIQDSADARAIHWNDTDKSRARPRHLTCPPRHRVVNVDDGESGDSVVQQNEVIAHDDAVQSGVAAVDAVSMTVPGVPPSTPSTMVGGSSGAGPATSRIVDNDAMTESDPQRLEVTVSEVNTDMIKLIGMKAVIVDSGSPPSVANVVVRRAPDVVGEDHDELMLGVDEEGVDDVDDTQPLFSLINVSNRVHRPGDGNRLVEGVRGVGVVMESDVGGVYW